MLSKAIALNRLADAHCHFGLLLNNVLATRSQAILGVCC